jgi:hypothetical protein
MRLLESEMTYMWFYEMTCMRIYENTYTSIYEITCMWIYVMAGRRASPPTPHSKSRLAWTYWYCSTSYEEGMRIRKEIRLDHIAPLILGISFLRVKSPLIYIRMGLYLLSRKQWRRTNPVPQITLVSFHADFARPSFWQWLSPNDLRIIRIYLYGNLWGYVYVGLWRGWTKNAKTP